MGAVGGWVQRQRSAYVLQYRGLEQYISLQSFHDQGGCQQKHAVPSHVSSPIPAAGAAHTPARAVTLPCFPALPQGYLSYPRTESTAYPPNFDFHTPLAAQRAHPIWGEYATSLVGTFSQPKGGERLLPAAACSKGWFSAQGARWS